MFEKVNRIIEEISDLKQHEESKIREMARDLDLKYIVKRD